jgi:hypothetical protein
VLSCQRAACAGAIPMQTLTMKYCLMQTRSQLTMMVVPSNVHNVRHL